MIFCLAVYSLTHICCKVFRRDFKIVNLFVICCCNTISKILQAEIKKGNTVKFRNEYFGVFRTFRRRKLSFRFLLMCSPTTRLTDITDIKCIYCG